VTCPRCGREAERREQFCGACGAFLGWDEGQPADDQLTPEQEPQKEEQRAGVQIRLENDLIRVAPGSAESTVFVVKNLGTKVEEFRFLVNGPEWVIAEPATVSVYPGQQATGAVQAAPPRTPDCAAGVTPFQLTVTSALHPNLSGSAAGQVDVAPYYEFAALLDPSSSRGRGWTRHTITLNNRGNTPLRILLDSADVADGLRLSLSAVAEVEPGMVTEVPVAVHGRRRWFGRPESKTFAVVAEPPKPLAPVRLAGTRVLVPILPKWVPVAVAGALAAVVAATVVHAATGKKPGPQPSGSNTGSGGPKSTGTPTKSNTQSPTPTPSVTVADVGGEPLAQAKEDLSNQGLKPIPKAFYNSTTPRQVVVKTSPVAGKLVVPGTQIVVFVTTGPYDMASVEVASNASWTTRSSAGVPPLRFGGTEADPQGAAFVVPQVQLEDGTLAQNALETNPPHETGAKIRGDYTLPRRIIANEQFSADIGFASGTGGKIEWEIIVGQDDNVVQSGTLASGDGVQHIQVDLTKYAGERILGLRVTALDASPSNDDVIWAYPRIEEANAPPPTPRPPAPSATATATTTGP